MTPTKDKYLSTISSVEKQIVFLQTLIDEKSLYVSFHQIRAWKLGIIKKKNFIKSLRKKILLLPQLSIFK